MIDNAVSCSRALRISFEILYKYRENEKSYLDSIKNKIIDDKELIKVLIGSGSIHEIRNYCKEELEILKELFRIFSFVVLNQARPIYAT